MKNRFSYIFIVVLIFTMSVSVFADTQSSMVDVGDHNLYAEDNNPYVKNNGNGNAYGVYHKQPTIVFETGYGDDHSVFDVLVNELDGKARLITYDRSNLGKSEDSNVEKNALNQTIELENLLDELHVKGDIIYVAHSIGGYNARVFADRNYSRVAGLVLIDTSHENQNETILNLLPDELKDMYMGQFTAEGTYEDVMTSSDLIRNMRDAFKDIPLTVIYGTNHGMGPNLETAWAGFQEDIASMSNRSKIVISEGSGHYVYSENVELVKNEILEMLEKVYQ